MNEALILKELKALIKEGNELKSKLKDWNVNVVNSLYYQDAKRWEGKAKNLLKVRFGQFSVFHDDFASESYSHYENGCRYYRENIAKATGVLEYIYDALSKGLVDDLFYKKELVIFLDMHKQAEEFLKQGYKRPAAIYGRIVLETTIKEYAKKMEAFEDVKFDQLIIKLRQKGIIHEPFETSLRANYKIGSMAAHADDNFEKLTDSEIREFLGFIRDKVLTLE
ncbi:MAG: DUF4145 domain-containing protein [Nanoarchaeota archaeon]|nr:DUF4145 domain-containing protein [Nanoarchaeota archaeon]